jgi:methylmalonyl-CoA mutase cobalamin-binding subunit
MAATVSALYGFKIIFLGPKTPESDIQACAEQTHAQAVLLSISITTPKETVASQLEYLSQILPQSVDLIVGGNGAPLNLSNDRIQTVSNLHELATWCQSKSC